MWGESSLNWVLELCPTSYIALIRQPWAIPSQWESHPPVEFFSTTRFLLLELLTLTHSFCSLTHLHQVIPCEGNHWLLSQTFPEVIGGVTSTQHVTSTMSFHPQEEPGWAWCINTTACEHRAFVMVQHKPDMVFLQFGCLWQKTKTCTSTHFPFFVF